VALERLALGTGSALAAGQRIEIAGGRPYRAGKE
jgi:hypothetical protein